MLLHSVSVNRVNDRGETDRLSWIEIT